jgi:hypothetical protein
MTFTATLAAGVLKQAMKLIDTFHAYRAVLHHASNISGNTAHLVNMN